MVGVSGIVLIVLVLAGLRIVSAARPQQPRSPGTADQQRRPVGYAARGLGHMFGAVNAPRRVRSVEDNLQRAFARIDAVDPYAGARRVGMALVEVGLLAPEPSETSDGPSRDAWPFNQPTQRERREDQE